MPTLPPSPDQMFVWFEQEIDILENIGRTGEPTRDPKSQFFARPFDDFIDDLLVLRDEIEARAYLAIVAATEAILQMDFRTRSLGRSRVLLREEAKELAKREKKGRRIEVETVLDEWANLPGARKESISEFKQLLKYRHWLAHGRYFSRNSSVPHDPGFAIKRARALLDELKRIDMDFPMH